MYKKIVLIIGMFGCVCSCAPDDKSGNKSQSLSAEQIKARQKLTDKYFANVDSSEHGGLRIELEEASDTDVAKALNSVGEIGELRIVGNISEAFMSELALIDSLRELDIREIDQGAIKMLNKFPDVTKFSIYGNSIFDISKLPQWQKCISLDLDIAPLKDSGIDVILGMPSLVEIRALNALELSSKAAKTLKTSRAWVDYIVGPNTSGQAPRK